MSVRGGIIVTGTEVLTGQIADRNGPWVSERLADRGVEVASILTVGDRPADMEAALAHMRGVGARIVVTTGGLGPTADDLTAEIVAKFAGRELRLDEEMERKIHDILEGFARRMRFDMDAVREANRKQAMVPEGAVAIDPAGTAPGLVVPAGDQAIVVLPGPPRELQAMWDQALDTAPAREALAGAEPIETRTIKMFGLPESTIAKTLAEIEAETDVGAVEVTTCLRGGELVIDLRHRPGADAAADAVVRGFVERHGDFIYTTDGDDLEDVIADLLDGRKLAVAESCTGGLLASRLTEGEGASEWFSGGAVTYTNEAKTELLGVPAELIEEKGAVSTEVAERMAAGALDRFEAQYGIGVTGIAGPSGGTKEKPVGYVCFCVMAADGSKLVRDPVIPGGRSEVRLRSAVVALHLLRYLLQGREPPR